MNKANQILPQFKNYLIQVQNIIKSELTVNDHNFSKTVLSYFNDKAKLIRPTLTLIAASYKNQISDKELKCAAAMEMLHVATLIHDDIIDNSNTRRGIETINSTQGSGYAVICGDYLFSKSFNLLFQANNYESLKYVGKNTVDMCFGEIKQFSHRIQGEISFEQYIDVIDKKTSALFQSNLAVGATLASLNDKQIELLIEFGLYFGRIFQINDDLNDFTKRKSEVGKPVLHDIKQGNYSLPVILVLDADKNLKKLIKHDVSKLYEIIIESDIISRCLQINKSFYDHALSLLEALPNELSNSLNDLLEVVYNNNY